MIGTPCRADCLEGVPRSLFDGTRIRVNLTGRQAKGSVQVGANDAVLDKVEALARACTSPPTLESVARELNVPVRECNEDLLRVGPATYDMAIVSNDTVDSFARISD